MFIYKTFRDWDIKQLVRDLWVHALDIELPTLAAAVSYYAMLSSIPLLALVLTLAARLLPALQNDGGNVAVGIAGLTAQQLNASLKLVMPPHAVNIVSDEIARIQQDPPVALLSVGLLLSLWMASNAFAAIISAMNKIYEVKETRPFWKVRLLAVVMLLVISLVLIAALVCILTLPVAIEFFHLSPWAEWLITSGQWLMLFLFLFLSFNFTYRIAPNRLPHRRLTVPGSLCGAGIFLFASVLFQAYVANFGSYQKVYGSLGGAIVFLVWTWVINACLLFGCVLNRTLDARVKESQPASPQ